MGSLNTTDLGPRVSATTDAGEFARGHGARSSVTRAKLTLTEANTAAIRGKDDDGSDLTKGVDELELDGQAMLNRQSSTGTLEIRSGNSIYMIEADNVRTL